MRYRVWYDRVFRDKDWVTESKVIEADNDQDALKKARALVRKLNRENKDPREKYELTKIRKVVSKARAEKLARLKTA